MPCLFESIAIFAFDCEDLVALLEEHIANSVWLVKRNLLCVLIKILENRRALKLRGPAVNYPDSQYAPRAAQQDLDAQTQNAQHGRTLLSNKQGAILEYK